MKILPVLLLLVHQPAAGPAEWQSHDLVGTDQLTVRLKVRPEASMLDTGWIKLEFENRTQRPLEVHFQCRADRVVPAADGRRATTATLFQQFTDRELAPKGGPRRGDVFSLPPGVTAVGEDLLAAAIANTLRQPPEEGRRVEAKARCVVNIWTNGPSSRLASPRDGVAFAFTWKRPGPKQIAAAREELTRQLLTAPVEQSALYRERLHALLAVPELHQDLTTDQVLAALARFSANDRRIDLLRALAIPRRQDPKIIAYYRDRLKASDESAAHELLHGEYRPLPGGQRSEEVYLWDPSFAEAAVAAYEQDPAKHPLAFALLIRRAKEWSGDATLTTRLAAAVRKQYPVMTRADLTGLTEADVAELMWGIMKLGHTRDRASLPWLKAALALTYDSPFKPSPVFMPNRPPGASVAHQAALAVVEILDGDHTAMSAWIGQRNPNPRHSVEDVIAYAKDRLARWEAESKKP